MTHLDNHGDDQTRRPGDAPAVVALEISDAVESLANLWSVAGHDAALRLSLPQSKALRTLSASPALNLTALAEWLDIGLPTASRLCDRLEAAGLVERASHPSNRREVQLLLTSAGQGVLRDIAGRRTQALTAVLGGMAPDERAALSMGLKAFLKARGAASPRPGVM
ncbi:MarR family transcriptional regulator [Streptomyces sp. M41(2017)]|uniref:MarR family winged helix-turn-helix transcriptional regulator n=1 Tax=Streptomyces sp. M41(2017) TaxID=1955065 RepID=UPI0009BDE9FB|nr:MarR family transcriptional regulator [Streptomyces sp. M41(2017)]OQQ20614.1 MarR family transcriptional regulator [Streptomyces sp. M41(2017)]